MLGSPINNESIPKNLFPEGYVRTFCYSIVSSKLKASFSKKSSIIVLQELLSGFTKEATLEMLLLSWRLWGRSQSHYRGGCESSQSMVERSLEESNEWNGWNLEDCVRQLKIFYPLSWIYRTSSMLSQPELRELKGPYSLIFGLWRIRITIREERLEALALLKACSHWSDNDF